MLYLYELPHGCKSYFVTARMSTEKVSGVVLVRPRSVIVQAFQCRTPVRIVSELGEGDLGTPAAPPELGLGRATPSYRV